MKPIYDYLETLDKWIDEVPPVQQPMRFGNKAFRTWLERVTSNADQMLESMVTVKEAIPEIKVYLIESFGSLERIDYGTGHELNFVVFLFCLLKLGVYKPDDAKAVINRVF